MSKNTIIAVDIDDTIGNTASEFVRYSNETWATELSEEDFDEDWGKVWGTGHEETIRRAKQIHEEDPRLFLQVGVKDNSFEVLQRLSEHFTVVCATSRRRSLAMLTEEWLDKHYPGVFSSLYFSGIYDDQSSDAVLLTKANILRDIGASYLIDDQPKHCLAAVENGIGAVLFGEYSWNRNHELPSEVRRCRDWLEVETYFNSL